MNKYQLRALQKFNQWSQSDYVILDTETTGLTKSAEVLEIAIIDKHGQVLVNTLVKPKGRIPKTASDIHGITRDMVKNSPTFPEVWKDQILPAIKDKIVLIYNRDYDLRVMQQSLCKWRGETFEYEKDLPIDLSLEEIYEVYELAKQTECVMQTYAQLKGYSRWGKLEKACGYKIKHRALDDCFATLKVIQDNVDLSYKEAESEIAATISKPKKKPKNRTVATTSKSKEEPAKKATATISKEEKNKETVIVSNSEVKQEKKLATTISNEKEEKIVVLSNEKQKDKQEETQLDVKPPTIWQRIVKFLFGK